MRDNLARQRVQSFATQEVGTIVALLGRTFRVRCGSGEHEARRAVSCLVAPALGDRVLVALHDEGCHVLAILDRDAEAPTRLVADGDLELSAPEGTVTVTAGEGVRVVSPGETAIASGTVRIAASDASLAVGALHYVGEQIAAQVDRVKTVSRELESVADRWVQRLGNAYRFITESEQVRAHYLEYSATAAVNVKAKTTIVSGGELAKIDGSQVHIG
ncbi:DUF3540 domain-containing protein [Polyangium jinanense]|uniref:DUF3540 domain-containing protein n=1 Tax=Polyangium jinanense TaxID=2829994 RepID=A0A9X4ARK1_9BACT|nr:DUF3540 domain-containing protein [Polyangium jinanense]MDC3952522.1 DUF3540 domain-containing protein [Polyangium jinanense]MDC3980150.1 DUF3540 domain-containing protein [Polyangium jinanense]